MSEGKKEQELQDEISVDEVDAENSEGTVEEVDLKKEETPLEEQLTAAKEEVVDLRDRVLRVAAENENFKKRVERERLASLKYAGETIFKEILPVVDNLERAVNQEVAEDSDVKKTLDALLEGVQLTLKSLVSTLEKFEVKAISSLGEPFDPKDQEALTMEPSDTVAKNHVITEFEKGYYYKDRLLRAAKVVVSSGSGENDS